MNPQNIDEFIRDMCAVGKLRTKSEVRARVEALLEPMYEIPCSDGNHSSFWKSCVESPEWQLWYAEVIRRMSSGKGKNYDVDECQEVGWISADHFASFMEYICEQAVQKERERIRKAVERADLIVNDKTISPDVIRFYREAVKETRKAILSLLTP